MISLPDVNVLIATLAVWRLGTMANTSKDADAEKLIIGRGLYDNLQTATVVLNEREIRLEPVAVPLLTILIYNAIFAAFFAGAYWLTDRFGNGGQWAKYAPVGVGIVTCLTFTVSVYYRFHRDRALGPWLIYDRSTGRLELPREHEIFERHEILQLQYITTKRPSRGDGPADNERLSELNLITFRDGQRQRWPLLRSIFTVNAFEHLLKPLVNTTDLPVVRVEDEWFGGNVTELPYRPRT